MAGHRAVSDRQPPIPAAHSPVDGPTEQTEPIDLLIVSEVTTSRPVQGPIRVFDQHVRRFGGYGPLFNTTWTIVERGSAASGRRTTALPPDISVAWLPSFRSKRHFLLTLPRQLKALWRPIRNSQAVLVNVPTFHAIPALVIARVLHKPSV